MDRVVRVENGAIQGTAEESCYGDRYLAFRGIPYAKPPVGELRFKDPQPPDSWTGVRDATKFGDLCAQFEMIHKSIMGSDDCLYLNVYTPSIESSKKRAVMVWIHGGGFVCGSGNDFLYGPDYLIRKDVVLVTINYRLGILGFLNLEDEVAPGNQGLKDQVMALKWVKKNISNFSGDPDNVTIFGESAGSASVHYLTISPMAEGLFHKAIAQSSVALNPWARVIKEPKRFGFQLAEKLGKKSDDPRTVVEFLRTIDAQELIRAQDRSFLTMQEAMEMLGVFAPGVDDKSPEPFLSQPPSQASQAGVKVPLIIGFNINEGSFLIQIQSRGVKNVMEKANEDFASVLSSDIHEIIKREGITATELKQMYFGDQPITTDNAQMYADFQSDIQFVRGVYDVIKIQAEKNLTPTYFYQFTYDTVNSGMKKLFDITLPGATHADDLEFLFYAGVLKNLGLGPFAADSTEYKIMKIFTQMWTDFAKTGNPTPVKTDLIQTLWRPLQNSDVYDYLNISDTISMNSVRKGEERCAWKKFKNKL